MKSKTPCVNKCKWSKERQQCVGCSRTMEEIVAAGIAAKKGYK